MKLIFIGTGTLNSKEMFHSNALLETPGGKRMLIDCGADCRHALKALGLWWEDIDSVYVSHLHGDHAGGLEQLGFARKFNPSLPLPDMFITEALADTLWEKTLSGGMRSLQNEVNSLISYFKVFPVVENAVFKWGDDGILEGEDFNPFTDNTKKIEFRPVQTVHIYAGWSIIHSYGLLFEINGIKVFFTSDTQYCPEQITDFYNWADIIFQDCETLPFKTGVHANWMDLVKEPPEIKAKMWLYHYQDGPLPDTKKAGFRGFVKQGQVFDFARPQTLGGHFYTTKP